MTMTTVASRSIDELYERDGEGGPSGENGDPSRLGQFETHPSCSTGTRPNGVWFGPRGSEATERELIALQGLHNGVAVLQWPRDDHRSEWFFSLGIPCQRFAQVTTDHSATRDRSGERRPQAPSDLQVHEYLEMLCDWAATQRSAATSELEGDGWLHLGEPGIELAPPGRLVLHGSNRSTVELVLALDIGIGRIVVDSLDEIERLNRLLGRVAPATEPRVLARVHPGVEVSTHASVATGREDLEFKFSLASGAAADAVDLLASIHSPVDLVGLRTQVGSQIFDLSTFGQTIDLLAPLVVTTGLTESCVGGGLGVAHAGDQGGSPSLTDCAAAVGNACRMAGIPDSVRTTAEPGRAVTATAAVTCCRIGAIKTVPLSPTDGVRTYVSVDGGMSDDLRPAHFDSRYEAFLPRAVTAPRPFPVPVAGQHCESGNSLVRNGCLPQDMAVGDLMATPVTGAYGYAMASNWNKLLHPPAVLLGDGRYRTVTRREAVEDLLGLDVDEPAVSHLVAVTD